MARTKVKIDGVVIGQFLGFGDQGPLVVFPGNPQATAVVARSLATLSPQMVGKEIALLFEGGDPEKPLVVGRIVEPASNPPVAPPEVVRDGERVRVIAGERIELRCGKATILMEKDGRIVIRGTHVTSQASGSNRIRGGSIDLN